MRIVQTPPYLRALKKLNANAADIARMEDRIIADPEIGDDAVPGLKGIRKLRFAMAGKGRKGGGWAIYYAVLTDDVVFMLTAYAKAEKEDLTPADKKLFLRLIEELS